MRNFQNKKKLLMFFGFWLLIALAVSSCARREIVSISSGGKNIICFGDSITYGVGAPRGYGYPGVLSRMMIAPVINAGCDGENTVEALRRLKADVLDRDPLLVIIEFGGNDFLQKIPVETTISNIREMVDKIHSAGAMVAIVDISTGVILQDYRQPFYNISLEKNTIFISHVLNGILTDMSLKSDPVHPNANGYKIIAHRIYRTITPYLNQNFLIRNLRGKVIRERD
jgi:acyl-CoA thioesterase I